MKVPAAVSAFSDIDLESSGISDTGDLTRFAPNVYLRKDANQNFIVIRGMTSFYGNRVSPVGIYVDDVALPFNGMHDMDVMDIRRIEILKGPQGTLYGKNSEAGVINVVTQQPGNEFQGRVSGEWNGHDTAFGFSPGYKVSGMVSGPLRKDELFYRFSAMQTDQDGFMKNEYNGDEKAGHSGKQKGRVNLTWKPSDRWETVFTADIIDFEGGLSDYRYITGPASLGPHRVAYDSPLNLWTQEHNSQILKLKYKGSAWDLVSVTGRRDYAHRTDSDLDCTAVSSPWAGDGLFKDENTYWSQEIRLSSSGDGRFQWLTGLFLFDEDVRVYVHQKTGAPQVRDTLADSTGYAVFGQTTYSPLDRLHITGGLRFDTVDMDGTQELTRMGTTSRLSKEISNHELLPKLSLAWDLSQDAMVYASVSKGYLHGGYNFAKAMGTESLTYDAEFSWNYEVGVKSAWFNNRLTANIAAFYTRMKDKQLAEWSDDHGSPVQDIKNAAEAKALGAEVEIKARPVSGLDLFANLGIVDARIDEWVAMEFNRATMSYSQYNYQDKKLPNVPEYTVNIGAQYRHDTGIMVRADLFSTGEFYNNAKNTASQDAYQLVNLRAGYEGEQFDIIFWCKNVFNEEYHKTQFDVGAHQMGIDGDPRKVGVTLTYRF